MTPLIETIFGLIFIFLCFSLITSWATEFLASRYHYRAQMLRRFLSDTLDDRFNAKNWGLMLYSHPLIESLGREVTKFRLFNKLGVKRRMPHYIPATQFATAFIENVIAHNKVSVFQRDEVTGRQVLAVEEASAANDDPYVQFVNAVESLAESEVKQTLQALIRNATGASPMEAVRTGLITWYESGMERVSGWYKRDTRTRLFLMGTVVAVVFNVNTFDVLHSLWVNPQLRGSVAKAADDYLAQHRILQRGDTVRNLDTLRARIAEVEGMLAPLQLPIGWPDAEAVRIATARRAEAERLDGLEPARWQQRTGRRTAILALRNPAHYHRWKAGTAARSTARSWRMPSIGEVWQAMRKNWIGWLATALALSFGAPFWFDALKRVANMRSSGAASRAFPTGGVPPTR